MFTDDHPAARSVHLIEHGGEPGNDRFLDGTGEIHSGFTVWPDVDAHYAGIGQHRGRVGHLHPDGDGQVMKRWCAGHDWSGFPESLSMSVAVRSRWVPSLWVPSQNGADRDLPHRHRARVCRVRGTTSPVE